MDNLIRCRCPGCSGKIKIPINLVAKRVKCTICNHPFVADLAFSPIDPPDLPVVKPIPRPAAADSRQSVPPRSNRRQVSSAGASPPSPQSEPAEITEIIDDDVPHRIANKQKQKPAAPEPAAITEFVEDTDEYERYKPARYKPKMQPDERRPSGGLSVKWTYRLFLVLFSIPLLTLIWIGIIRWLICHLATACTCLLTSTIRCPGCRLVYPATDIWKCSCGYQPHYEKHILAFVCRLCGKRVGHTTCQRCGTTIFVR